MDDRTVSPWVGALALGVALAALAAVVWLIAPLSHDTSGITDQVSVEQVPHALSPHHRLLNRMERCSDSASTRGMPGCAAASFPTSAPPASSSPPDRRAHRSTRPVAAVVAPPSSQVSVAPAPASPAPAIVTQTATPAPVTATRQASPHGGPVPGGTTSPPHTGPRP
jgi:hypothetical protein